MAVSGEHDLDRSGDLRKRAAAAKGTVAKRIMLSAADRLEARGARKLSRLGKKKRKTAGAVPVVLR